MRQVSNDSPSRAKQHILRHLDVGATGCLHARLPNGVAVSVYVMLGEVLAAHASDDRERLIRLLSNAGAVQPDRLEGLRKTAAMGHSITDELYDVVGDEAMQDVLHERFRENLFGFLQVQGTVMFEPMESVMVENIQVGHNSRVLIDEVDALLVATARLREPPGLVMAPGAGTMRNPDHLRIASIAHPRLPLQDLLLRSPWESGRTLGMVAEMLERGALIAVVAPKDSREITDRPTLRTEPRAAKLTIPSGKSSDPGHTPTDPPRANPLPPPIPTQRDTVAAALASAVTAAVAKVGRQRAESTSTGPTHPPAPARPAEEPISSPMSRSTAPAKMVVGGPKPNPFPSSPVPPAAPVVATPAAVERPATPARNSPVAPTAPPQARPEPLTKPAPKPPPPLEEPPTEEVDAEMAMFQDYDHAREGGDFMSAQQLLDRVEIVEFDPLKPGPPPPTPAEPPATQKEIFIEMEDAENATHAELAGAVSLNFAGPKLGDDEAHRKLDVINDVFATMVRALDAVNGVGMGQSRVQLLVEGTPGAFAALFKGVEVDSQGRLPVEVVLRNLRKRPAAEHRRLLNRGLSDVIERALSLASEELDEAGLEAMLEKIAGYQQRLGM